VTALLLLWQAHVVRREARHHFHEARGDLVGRLELRLLPEDRNPSTEA
jgi:hypothetical protein